MLEHQWMLSGRNRLSLLITRAETAQAAPVVICCHGFCGNKTGTNQMTRHVSEAIAAAGCHVVRFDFAGSGESEGDFAIETVVSKWQDSLRDVIDFIKAKPEFSSSPLVIYGHSMGGLVCLTTSTSWEDDIIGRIAVAPVIYPEANFRAILGEACWRDALSGRDIANFDNTGFVLKRGLFVKDIIAKHYDPFDFMADYDKPLLLVHGTLDGAVPYKGSEDFAAGYGGRLTFKCIDWADHLFTGYHDQLTTIITDWLETLRTNS